MWVIGRILLIILMIIGVLLFAAGITSLVGANSWVEQLVDVDVDSGVFIGAGAGALALGVILIAISSLFLFRRHRPKVDIQEKIMPDD